MILIWGSSVQCYSRGKISRVKVSVCSTKGVYWKMGSVEFLPDNNNHDCLPCLRQVMENHLALDLLDLVPVFSCLQFLAESPFEH